MSKRVGFPGELAILCNSAKRTHVWSSEVWRDLTPAKGEALKSQFEAYLTRTVIKNTESLSSCTLTNIIATGGYGYVYKCILTPNEGDPLHCAVKIRLCNDTQGEADVDYFNKALTAAKHKPHLTRHLPLLNDLSIWHYCEERVGNIEEEFPCAVIFMEWLPHSINAADDIDFEVDALCKLTQKLFDAKIYYPDLKDTNIMLRGTDDVVDNVPVLVDLDALLVYDAAYYDFELVATYFPFNMKPECLSLKAFQPNEDTRELSKLVSDFDIVAKYVTAVAGICTAVAYFLQATNNYAYDVYDSVSHNYNPAKQTSHEHIVRLFEKLAADPLCQRLTENKCYKELQNYITSAAPFSDAFAVVDENYRARFGTLYTCRARFADVTF